MRNSSTMQPQKAARESSWSSRSRLFRRMASPFASGCEAVGAGRFPWGLAPNRAFPALAGVLSAFAVGPHIRGAIGAHGFTSASNIDSR